MHDLHEGYTKETETILDTEHRWLQFLQQFLYFMEHDINYHRKKNNNFQTLFTPTLDGLLC